MTFYLAPALVVLRDQVNAHYPHRDKASDGWIGDTSHAARPSDHNPDWNSLPPGVVRAIDIDITPDGRPDADLRRELLRITIGDPRVWYVISNRVIYSRTHDWAPLAYTGSNAHLEHVHVSLRGADGSTPEAAHDTAFDPTVWWPGGTLQPVSLRRLTRAARHPEARVHPNSVSRVQTALTGRGLGVTCDGVYGPETRKAAATWQARQGLPADGILGRESAELLGRNRFKVIA